VFYCEGCTAEDVDPPLVGSRWEKSIHSSSSSSSSSVSGRASLASAPQSDGERTVAHYNCSFHTGVQ